MVGSEGEISQVQYGLCQVEELSELISLIDAEFIFARGREISLKIRFPQLFCRQNCHNIYVAKLNNKVAATVTLKPFIWQVETEIYHGAMIGMVLTLAQFRGKGLGSLLMQYVQADLKDRNFDFGVLWTGKPDFYQRLGWNLSDRSILGVFKQSQINVGLTVNNDSVTVTSLQNLDNHKKLAEILQIYQQSDFGARGKVQRSLQDYLTIPIPANSVNLFICNEAKMSKAYALVGQADDTAYIYEVVGHPLVFNQLWMSIIKNYSNVWINTYKDSILHEWLNQHSKVCWEPQLKAMWYQFTKEKQMAFDQWYVPFSDRI